MMPADCLPLLAQLGPNVRLDPRTNILLFSVLAALLIAYFVGRTLRRQPESTVHPAIVQTFNQRVLAWLIIFGILFAALIPQGRVAYICTIVLFGLVSFWALREFITMTPTRRGDHRTLFLTFFVFTPAQYIAVGLGRNYYGLYTLMIPVYASLMIPAMIAISGDPKRFLERVAKIQAGLMICVYCLSHAPAVLDLDLRTSRHGQPWFIDAPAPPAAQNALPAAENPAAAKNAGNGAPAPAAAPAAAPAPRIRGSNASVLFFFILIVQLNDVFQYVWSQLRGKHVIAPQINASRTWEGLIGGVLSTTAVGMLLWWATPFRYWAGPIAGVVALAGFAGSMTMSGIKRDRNVRDYGTLVSGHAGVLDRIDSLCFAAPVFFHITRYFFT
jgi:phosphatidate cytidylyltransferase